MKRRNFIKGAATGGACLLMPSTIRNMRDADIRERTVESAMAEMPDEKVFQMLRANKIRYEKGEGRRTLIKEAIKPGTKLTVACFNGGDCYCGIWVCKNPFRPRCCRPPKTKTA